MKHSGKRAGYTLVELLVTIAIIGILLSLLLPAAQSIREAARRVTCSNNVKQLGLAIHSFEGSNGRYPPSKVKNPGHGWVAFVLPHLDQPNVADRYHRNVSWNHPVNQDAVNTVIPTFICPSTPVGPHLRQDRFPIGVGSAAVSDYATITQVAKIVYTAGHAGPVPNSHGVLRPDKGIETRDILDGLSNTLVITEDAGRPLSFIRSGPGPNDSKPGGGNLPIINGRVRGASWADTSNAIPVHGFTADGLSVPGPCPVNCTNNNEAFGFHPGLVIGLLCDGSVHAVDEGITMQEYSEFVTRAGREINSYE